MSRFRNLIATVPALMLLVVPAFASAHVTVSPDTATVGAYTTFTVSVPNEKDSAVTEVKLDIPAGLKGATPTVKPGWTITTDKSGEGESAVVRSITWSAGSVPAGFRDEFTFRGQTPAKSSELVWKAHQTYEDGTVVNWDQKPSAAESDNDDSNAGPYSVTNVVDDLATAPAAATTSSNNTALPIGISLVALAVSFGSILFRKK